MQVQAALEIRVCAKASANPSASLRRSNAFALMEGTTALLTKRGFQDSGVRGSSSQDKWSKAAREYMDQIAPAKLHNLLLAYPIC